MKIKLIMTNIFITFLLPLYNAAAQEADTVTEITASGGGGAGSGAVQGALNSIPGLITKGINAVAQIGNLFGNVTGIRIGGTTGTAIATLIIAKMVEDKAPTWVKWLLYGTGGTMIAGGGANIFQLISKYF